MCTIVIDIPATLQIFCWESLRNKSPHPPLWLTIALHTNTRYVCVDLRTTHTQYTWLYWGYGMLYIFLFGVLGCCGTQFGIFWVNYPSDLIHHILAFVAIFLHSNKTQTSSFFAKVWMYLLKLKSRNRDLIHAKWHTRTCSGTYWMFSTPHVLTRCPH